MLPLSVPVRVTTQETQSEGPDPTRYSKRNSTKSTSNFCTDENENHMNENESLTFRAKRPPLNTPEKEMRFNTMVKKRNLVGLKTGRPVAFLSATPRFDDAREKTIKLYAPQRLHAFTTPSSPLWSTEIQSNALSKPRTEKPIPKNSPSKLTAEKIQVYAKRL